MQNIDFKVFINAVKNDLIISLDDLFKIIEVMKDDIEKLKAEKADFNKN